jgi:hypothetical protein
MGIHITRTFGAQAHAELWDSIHVSKDLKDSLTGAPQLHPPFQSNPHGDSSSLNHPSRRRAGNRQDVPRTRPRLQDGGFAPPEKGRVPRSRVTFARQLRNGQDPEGRDRAVRPNHRRTCPGWPDICAARRGGDRGRRSKQAESGGDPTDVHRATDAALVQLGYLGEQFPNY